MTSIFDEETIRRHFALKCIDAITVPCAYFTQMQDSLENPEERRRLAHSLARVVRAWSESSIRVGLSSEDPGLIDEIYNQLADTFFEKPEGLPYQYCLIELIKAENDEGWGY